MLAVASKVTNPPLAPLPLASRVFGDWVAAAPGAERGERAVEARAEEDRVVVLARAEPAGVDPALDGPVTHHVDLRVEHVLVRPAGVEQDVRLAGRRERVALPAGPRGGGQLRVDPVRGEPDPVVARRRLLVGVRERGLVHVGVDAGDRPGRRQDRQLALDPAAHPGQVRLAEPVDRVGLVVVPALAARVGADLHHAERRAGPRERVAEVLGPDEGIDQAQRIGIRGPGRRGEPAQKSRAEQGRTGPCQHSFPS